MTKLLSMIVAAMFAAVSVSAIAASHAGAQGDKMDKKATRWTRRPTDKKMDKKDPKTRWTRRPTRRTRSKSSAHSVDEKAGLVPAFFFSDAMKKLFFLLAAAGLPRCPRARAARRCSFPPACT